MLFVKMAEKHELTPELVKEIKDSIRRELSARHVPAIIDACPEIPVTTNGKKYVPLPLLLVPYLPCIGSKWQ